MPRIGGSGGRSFRGAYHRENVVEQGDELPSGVIVMWSGTLASIPQGWSLCDGVGGRPDLRDRNRPPLPLGGVLRAIARSTRRRGFDTTVNTEGFQTRTRSTAFPGRDREGEPIPPARPFASVFFASRACGAMAIRRSLDP